MARSSTPIIQVSRKGLLIWIGLIVFVSFWMFILGVMVGRGMAPVNLETGHLEQELAEQKARMLKEKQEAAVSAAAGQTDEKPQLGFYEALKNPGRDTTFQPAKPVKPVRRKPAASPRPKATPPPPARVSKPKSKPPATQKSGSGSRPSPSSTPGHFTVQVASVQDIKGAERMVVNLRAKGYQAYQIRSVVAGKGTWYRIRVGGFEDRRAAEDMLRKLKNDKFDGIVVSTK
jgi:cell division septation protein DedD